MDSTTIY